MAWQVLFNVWFYLLFIVYTLVVTLIFLVRMVLVACFRSNREKMRALRNSIVLYGKGVVYLLVYPYIRVRYRDSSGGTPGSGPFVVVCNHRSSSDPFLMACLSIELVQVVNDWPFRLPILGVVARLAGYLSIRTMPFEEFLLKGKKLLQEGVVIVAFPEGTRSSSKAVGPFHGAVFRLCLETQVPIVPVCIMGSEDKPRRSSLFLHPGVVEVHRLPSVSPQDYRTMNAYKLKNHVRSIIVEHLQREEGTVVESA